MSLNSGPGFHLGSSPCKHFYRTGGLWREDAGLIFHVAGIPVMRSGHVPFLCSF